MIKRSNFNQWKSWHVIRKEVNKVVKYRTRRGIKNSHIFFSFSRRQGFAKYCRRYAGLLASPRSTCAWKPNGTGKLTCLISSKLDVAKLNVVVKLGSVLLLIEIKHWKGILWLYSCTRRADVFFFFKRDPKVIWRRGRQGVNFSLRIIFWLAQLSVSRKSKLIAQQNFTALEATRNIMVFLLLRKPMLITLLSSLLLKYQ